jgi:hypothetical protein
MHPRFNQARFDQARRHQAFLMLAVWLLCTAYASNPAAKLGSITVPDVTLQAIVSERDVPIADPEVLTVLIFHGEDTAAAASEVNFAIRQAFPSASRVLIASVVDLGYVPEMFRGLARDAMQSAFYKEKDTYLPEGYSADDYIVILPDWHGDVTEAFGFQNVDETLAVVVLEERGRVLLATQADSSEPGDDLAGAAITIVRRQMMTALRPGVGL